MAELGLVKQAVKVPLVEVLALVKEVHEGVSTVNQELALCPGLGERKVHRLRETFSAPFVPHAAGAAHPR